MRIHEKAKSLTAPCSPWKRKFEQRLKLKPAFGFKGQLHKDRKNQPVESNSQLSHWNLLGGFLIRVLLRTLTFSSLVLSHAFPSLASDLAFDTLRVGWRIERAFAFVIAEAPESWGVADWIERGSPIDV